MPRFQRSGARHRALDDPLRLSAFASQTACRRDKPVLPRDESFAFIGGGGERARTVDLLLAKQALSQLSYTPVRRQISEFRYQNCRCSAASRAPPAGIGGADI
jgi:hypothetical protein